MPYILLFLAFLLPNLAYSRPEYAVRNGIVNCRACHVSPAGGNLRNLNGKLYNASHRGFSFKPKKMQDYVSLNSRILYYKPEVRKDSRSGLGLMNATLGLVVPIEEEANSKKVSIAGAIDFGAFTTKREVFLLWAEDDPKVFQSLLLGKFNSPFGLMTDEHRTYTKIQNKTTINNFEMGAMFSGALLSTTAHYDIAWVSGFQGGGTLASEDLSGAIVNIRWSPARKPFFIGTSGSYHSISDSEDPFSYALYFALSFDQLTNSSFKGSLLFESVVAKYYNATSSGSRVVSSFVGANTGLETAVQNSESLGHYALLNIDLNPLWTLQYKLDWLALDRNFDGDHYTRHGVGFRHQLSRQVYALARYEMAAANRTDLESDLAATQDAFYAVLNAYW